MSKKKLNTAFYQNLAKLFYAIANIDNHVRDIEVQKLKSIVKDKWLAVDDTEDVFGTDAAYQIEIVFDWLNSNDTEAMSAYNDFIEYYRAHHYFFEDTIKDLVLQTASDIANAFSGINKSELVILGKLNLEFKNK